MDSKEPYMAIKVWKCMMENYGESDLEEAGNMLVVELRYHHMVPEGSRHKTQNIPLNHSQFTV